MIFDPEKNWQVDSHGAALRQMAEAGKIQQVLKTIEPLDGELRKEEFVTQKKGATRIISPLTLW